MYALLLSDSESAGTLFKRNHCANRKKMQNISQHINIQSKETTESEKEIVKNEKERQTNRI